MSAITGIFYRKGDTVDETQIKKMNDRLSHRGLNGSDFWFEGSVGLGHQMLHTTHESLHEKLPFAEDGLVITADARIDNRSELSQKLGVSDTEDISDSYFILKAYQKWGEKCSCELLGDFAFAIWDTKEGKLFCARDHMGVKPFYYYLTDELFVFATELKAILSIPEVPLRINEVRVAQYLLSILGDREITFYEGIRRLPAAHSLKINSNSFLFDKYWVLDPHFELKLSSDEEYVDKFKEIFTESVNCRLRSAFDLGFSLSGGLDSSSVFCTARQLLKERGNNNLKTFSAIFNNVPESDEQEFIKAVLDGGYVEPTYLNADKVSPLVDNENMFWHEDEPFYGPNLFIEWCLSNKARDKGVRIILGGYDGDSTISHGVGFLNELLFKGKFKKFIDELKSSSKTLNLNPYRLFITTLIATYIPDLAIKVQKSKSNGKILSFNREKLIKEDFMNGLATNDFIEYRKKTIKPRDAKKYHYDIINSGNIQFLLEILDRVFGAHGIEPRHPFFDRRLIEFSYGIPTEQKFSHGWDRIILRRAMNNILPPKIRCRRHKARLGANFRRNLLLFETELIENVIYNDSYLIKDFVNIDVLKNSYSIFKEGKPGYKKASLQVWNALTLILWLKLSKI